MGGEGAAQRRPPQGPGKGMSFTPHEVGTPAEGARPQRAGTWSSRAPGVACPSCRTPALSALCPESWPHADPLPMGPNSSVNSRHSNENHLSLSLWGFPGFYNIHRIINGTTPCCHPWHYPAIAWGHTSQGALICPRVPTMREHVSPCGTWPQKH